ncbi:hypothetical protein Tco_0886362 [Tanacetum coccineum]
MNKKDKERPCEQIFEVDRGIEVEGEQNNQEMKVYLEKTDAHKTIDPYKQGASRLKDIDFQNKSECTDWAKHLKISALTPKTLSSFDAQFDHVKVVSTVEEPSLVLPENDIPSFDLGLTPTPPDVIINADKQDVSNQEPMLENVPLTFTRITAKLKLPPKKEKEQDSTTIASTIVKFLELVEVVSTTVKEPSTVLLLNDAPSFDLGLTPTPPDVNLDRDTEPMLENERVKKNAKEQGTTNTTSPVDALALSFAMLNITLVTYAIERKRKDLPMLENEHVKKNAKESGLTNTRTAFDVVALSFAMSNATLVTDERQKHVEVILSISHLIK